MAHPIKINRHLDCVPNLYATCSATMGNMTENRWKIQNSGVIFFLFGRLSEIAGSRLKFNNPGITDLSDDNRPNKLAEKFSELYDNEWTEAFEDLGCGGIGEVEIIERLLGLLEVMRCLLLKLLNCLQNQRNYCVPLVERFYFKREAIH